MFLADARWEHSRENIRTPSAMLGCTTTRVAYPHLDSGSVVTAGRACERYWWKGLSCSVHPTDDLTTIATACLYADNHERRHPGRNQPDFPSPRRARLGRHMHNCADPRPSGLINSGPATSQRRRASMQALCRLCVGSKR